MIDEGIIMHCIQQCHFGKGDSNGKHYHSLALKVFDSQMIGRYSRELTS